MLTQINLQTHFGGGEVYTGFLCRALDQLNIPTKILIHPSASFWHELSLPSNTTLTPMTTTDINQSLTKQDKWIMGHGALPIDIRKTEGRIKSAIAHMPIQDRSAEPYFDHDMIFPVSAWVREGLMDEKLPSWSDPLYGVADLEQRQHESVLTKKSRYDWDLRKGRDFLLSKLEPYIEPFIAHPQFKKKSGITLGLVSRLTPIKQFPLLFSIISPILAKYPEFNLEIFGSGGYASVRDLNQALTPLKGRVRYWGHQSDVTTIYKEIDYLMTGLPEKEALGLNVIESQACGTPVLAPNAAPFNETVIDNITGYLYCDPRIDSGDSFEELLKQISSLQKPTDPLLATEHLNNFSLDSFVKRLEPIVEWANKRI